MGEFDDTDYDSSSEINDSEIEVSSDDASTFDDISDDSFTEDDIDDLNAEAQEAYDEYDLAHEDFSEDDTETEDLNTEAQETYDEYNLDYEDVSEDNAEIEENTEIEDTIPDSEQDVSENEERPSETEENPSDINSLYEQGQKDMLDAQAKAEAWADEQDMTEWADGTPRTNAKLDESANEFTEDSPEMQQEDSDTTESEDANKTGETEKAEEEGEIEKVEEEAEELRKAEETEAEQKAALEADVKAQGDTLNKEYIDLMNRRQAAFDSTIDATSVEDRDRFADLQYDLGEQMEQVRSKIIENNNRLK